MKVGHAIDFLCEDMKVKVALRFKGREMAHTEFGFQVVQQFLEKIAAYGHADFEPKLNGRSIVIMVSPLARNKRAKHPNTAEPQAGKTGGARGLSSPAATPVKTGFSNNPFAQLEASNG